MEKLKKIVFGALIVYIAILGIWLENLGGFTALPSTTQDLLIFAVIAPCLILMFFGIFIESLWNRLGKERPGYTSKRFRKLIKIIVRNKGDKVTKNIALSACFRLNQDQITANDRKWAIVELRSKNKYGGTEKGWLLYEALKELEQHTEQFAIRNMREKLKYRQNSHQDTLKNISPDIALATWSVGLCDNAIRKVLETILAENADPLEKQRVILAMDECVSAEFQNLPEQGQAQAQTEFTRFTRELRKEVRPVVVA